MSSPLKHAIENFEVFSVLKVIKIVFNIIEARN